MLDFESMFDIGFQVLKYYFYVSVSYHANVFSLAKFGRLVVRDEYVELFDGLCFTCACIGDESFSNRRKMLTKWFEGFMLSF